MSGLNKYTLQHPNGFVFGTAVEYGRGWKFLPHVSGHKTSRKYWPTADASLPSWARKWLDKGCSFLPSEGHSSEDAKGPLHQIMSDLYEKTHLEINALRIVHLRQALEDIAKMRTAANVEDLRGIARDALHDDDVTVDIAENGPLHDPPGWESEIAGDN